MMKLLICRRGWSPTGGAERFLQRFGKGLSVAGIPSILIADSRWPDDAWHGDAIERVGSTDPEGFAKEVLEIKNRHPDVLLFSMERLPGAGVFRAGDGLHSAWLSRLAAEGSALAAGFRRRRKMHRQVLKLEQRLFENPHLRVVANSRMMANELVSGFGFTAENIAVIPNGYDSVLLEEGSVRAKRAALRLQLGIPDDAVIYLFVGSGCKRKGAQILVDAFRKLDHPKAWLILVGKGRVARAAHPRIHLAGAVNDPLDWFVAADVFVLPTLYDPFSNACLEAASYGLPIITTDANGFQEVLETYPDAGQVVHIPRAVEAWTEALKRWLDPTHRTEAKPSLAAIRDHYTVKRNVDATVDFIQKSFGSF